MTNYTYIETLKGYDLYSYTSGITGVVEGYTAVIEGQEATRDNSILKGLLAPSIKVLRGLL